MRRPDQHGFPSGHNGHSLAETHHAQRQQVQAHRVQLQSETQRAAQMQQTQLQRAQMQEALSMNYMSGVNINSSFGPSTSGGTSNALARPPSLSVSFPTNPSFGIFAGLTHTSQVSNNGPSANLSFVEHFPSPVGGEVSQGLGSVPNTPTGLRFLSRNPMLSEDVYSNQDEGLDMGMSARHVSVSAQSSTNAVHAQGQRLGPDSGPAAAGAAEARANNAGEVNNVTDYGNAAGTGTRAGSMESEDTGY